ncbi:hypothetical protein IID24_02690 [Patescibacteria group bacterium]|nr:hypothetical protein [Patescibacteria group bacterium]
MENEKGDLTREQLIKNVLEVGMQLIPVVGGSLATFYFGEKQQREFNRLQAFYKELAEDVKNLQEKPSLENQDEEKLAALIEKINNKVEKEVLREKINYFKSFFKNILVYPVKADYDEKTFFLETIDSMSLLEIDLLKVLSQQETPPLVKDITKEGVEQYAVVGAVSRLRNFGFLELSSTAMTLGGERDDRLTEKLKVSPFGKKFIAFCLDS